MELYLESPLNVDVDIMPPSEVEKIFRTFAEERKRALPQFTPDGIPITMENKFDDATYHYLYEYWKTNSGEYDPKDDEIIMTKENSFTKNEKKFEQWLLQQYGMTKKEERGYTLEGNLDSLWEIFSAADMVLLVKALPNIGKNLVQLGKDVLENGIQFDTSLGIVAGGGGRWQAKKQIVNIAEDLSQKAVHKENRDIIKAGFKSRKVNIPKNVERQAKKLSAEAKKGYEKAIDALKSGDVRGLNDHPLSGNRSGQRAIDIKGTGKGRGAGRIIYEYGKNEEINILEILTDHRY